MGGGVGEGAAVGIDVGLGPTSRTALGEPPEETGHPALQDLPPGAQQGRLRGQNFPWNSSRLEAGLRPGGPGVAPVEVAELAVFFIEE